jgi:hypothetical protein
MSKVRRIRFRGASILPELRFGNGCRKSFDSPGRFVGYGVDSSRPENPTDDGDPRQASWKRSAATTR